MILIKEWIGCKLYWYPENFNQRIEKKNIYIIIVYI